VRRYGSTASKNGGRGLNLTVFLRFPAASPKGEGNWLVYRRILP
jgi:hypothetical protein